MRLMRPSDRLGVADSRNIVRSDCSVGRANDSKYGHRGSGGALDASRSGRAMSKDDGGQTERDVKSRECLRQSGGVTGDFTPCSSGLAHEEACLFRQGRQPH